MSVWLTPELKPFVGGTYFPPEDRYGQPGFTKVLERIAMAWKQGHEKISEQGTNIIAALEQAAAGPAAETGRLGQETLKSAYQQIARSYDAPGWIGVAPNSRARDANFWRGSTLAIRNPTAQTRAREDPSAAQVAAG